jgi:uncharacterized protein (DUF2147 family)
MDDNRNNLFIFKLFKTMKMRSLFLLIACMFAAIASAQSAFLGEWVTIDDESGEKKSVVNIYKGSNGLYYGKIKTLFENPNSVCTACTGNDHNKPVVGLVIVRDMQLKGEELQGGKILDPANGKLYYAKMSIKNGKLVLRGSLDKAGILGRSQTWVRK